MSKTSKKRTAAACLAAACALSVGCGDVVRQGRAPVQLVIRALEAAPGAEPEQFGGKLQSDVVTMF